MAGMAESTALVVAGAGVWVALVVAVVAATREAERALRAVRPEPAECLCGRIDCGDCGGPLDLYGEHEAEYRREAGS